MAIERMSGFSHEGGQPIPGDIVDGDVIRINGTEERRYYTPAPPPETPPTPPQPTKAELLAKVEELLTAVEALADD